ncbi:MAG: hypothetical protein P4L40_09735 [Terracidiphilus sp.]|nr:hypothetical protein [Terracidiphilus sp.]
MLGSRVCVCVCVCVCVRVLSRVLLAGTDVPWSSAWEEVYATLNLDPEERVPSRRIRVMRAYEEFLLRLELALLPIIAAKVRNH